MWCLQGDSSSPAGRDEVKERPNFGEIDAARKLLGLGEEATLEEIKGSYRRLSRKYHPDLCHEEKKACEEMMRKINWAYETLMSYVRNYRFSFREEDVRRSDPEEPLRRFYRDWMWGKEAK